MVMILMLVEYPIVFFVKTVNNSDIGTSQSALIRLIYHCGLCDKSLRHRYLWLIYPE
jgi:hypothetical protein